MRDALGPGTMLGYCTNVHAGVTLEETKRNLDQHACAVKAAVSPATPMGIGLWLSAAAASDLRKGDQLMAFRDWLGERGLLVFTLNGFPYADFHQPVVKHEVYRPDWTTAARRDYTIDLITILASLLPAGTEGSISTLPIGWPDGGDERERLAAAAAHLEDVATQARIIEQETGRVIHVDVEPEPGCLLQRSDDVVRFFDEHLAGGEVRRHLRVCHDICHAAVMFEDQGPVFERYRAAGVRIGKVQVSSAVRLDLAGRSARERVEALAELRRFAEDRYLHQTVVREGDDLVFYDDLPAALNAYADTDRAGDEWRVHFHVPVFLDAFGSLGTTRDLIPECLDLLRGEVAHWEVETYAWDVLPDPLRTDALPNGIARELEWVLHEARARQST